MLCALIISTLGFIRFNTLIAQQQPNMMRAAAFCWLSDMSAQRWKNFTALSTSLHKYKTYPANKE